VSAIAAKVLAVWIFLGNLGDDRRLAKPVRAVGPAVWSAQCAVALQGAAAIPEEGMLRAAWSQVGGTAHPAHTIQVIR
jgi:hypothetical protein